MILDIPKIKAQHLRFWGGKKQTFGVDEQMVIWRLSSSHKLRNAYIGTSTGIELAQPYSVVVKLDDVCTRNMHVNDIRPLIARADHIGLLFDKDSDFGELYYAPNGKDCNSKES